MEAKFRWQFTAKTLGWTFQDGNRQKGIAPNYESVNRSRVHSGGSSDPFDGEAQVGNIRLVEAGFACGWDVVAIISWCKHYFDDSATPSRKQDRSKESLLPPGCIRNCHECLIVRSGRSWFSSVHNRFCFNIARPLAEDWPTPASVEPTIVPRRRRAGNAHCKCQAPMRRFRHRNAQVRTNRTRH